MLRFCRRARLDGRARVQIGDLAELNVACAKLGAIETHKRVRLLEPRTIFDRTHARPAACHQRPGWRASPRRGLFDPFDHSFGEGQEWKSVFLLNTVDGCLPSDLATGTIAEIEEERRLLYVAMTRAKDNLHLIVPQRFFAHLQQSNGDRHMYASP